MKRESKKLTYKFAGGFSNGDNLQSALTKCLALYPKAKHRVEPLGNDNSEVRFINVTRKHEGMLMGIFHKLTQGAGQYVIEMGDVAEAWNVELITANAPGKSGREFVEGSLYFGIWKNHVIMHQTSPCRSEQLQDYSSWLIAKAMSRGATGPVKSPLIALSDPLPKEMRKKAGRPVKAVRFGGSLGTEAVQIPTRGGTTKTGVRFSPSGGMWEGIKNMLLELKAPVPEELFFDGALGDQDIEVHLELSCSKKKAQYTAGEVLGTLGRALSHTDLVDYEVELADGTKIRPRQLKVEKTVRVECVQKQPIPEPLFVSMVEWMAELVDTQTVIEEDPFGNIR